MTALLLDDRLEGVDECGRKEARPLCRREKPKGKKGIDAFAKAGEQEAPLREFGRQVFGLRGEADTVRRNEVRQNLLVACFPETVEFPHLSQQAVGQRSVIS